MQPSKNIQMLLLISILALGLILFLVVPKLLTPTVNTAAVSLTMNENCNLTAQPCLAGGDPIAPDARAQLTINPSPQSMVPLRFEVRLDNIMADRVTLSLDGKDMYMGVNSVEMKRKLSDANTWYAETELSICATEKMLWLAHVKTYNEGNETVKIDYEFWAK